MLPSLYFLPITTASTKVIGFNFDKTVSHYNSYQLLQLFLSSKMRYFDRHISSSVHLSFDILDASYVNRSLYVEIGVIILATNSRICKVVAILASSSALDFLEFAYALAFI